MSDMDHQFWRQKWEAREIGFHQLDVNPFLKRYFSMTCALKGARVFVPLCGKTRDIAWLLGQGYHVSGIELSPIAVEELFQELGVNPQVLKEGSMVCYSAENINIWCGDFFELSKNQLGEVRAVYDRAALVALPQNMRQRYATHLQNLTDHASQLIITFLYDQSLMEGPPFSVQESELRSYYKKYEKICLLESIEIPGGFREVVPAVENIWLLR